MSLLLRILFFLSIKADSHSFDIYSHNCPANGALNASAACTVIVRYTPESEAVHSSLFNINYSNYYNQSTFPQVSLVGEGITPLANFKRWSEIYAATGDIDAELKIKWEAFVPTLAGITIDGYKVYQSIGSALPSGIDNLAPFEILNIVGDDDVDRAYSLTGALPDTIYHIAIRPYYSTQIMDSPDLPSNLKIYIPPVNMSFIHPYIVNQETCFNMGLTSLNAEQLGCSYLGAGNTDGIYKFDKYLFVDRYEISQTNGGAYENLPSKQPLEFINQFVADSSCKSFNFGYQGQAITKRLLTRSEWVAAAAWPESYSVATIDSIEEDTNANDCKLKQLNPVGTGSSSMCLSRYGAYDMVGNLWEWNSDQVNGTIGWSSLIDANNDMFGMNLGGILPEVVTNLPCFSYIFGVAQSITVETCPNGVEGSSISNIVNDYFLPPLGTNNKSVRSGGGVGPEAGLAYRKGGRWVGDFNPGFTDTTPKTGARCSFSLDF